MQDRTPTPGQEGRVLITPENGSPYYAKIEMADNPTQPGTPLNKDTLLKDATAALYELGTDAVPDDVFEVLSNAALYEDGKFVFPRGEDIPYVSIETGSYVGTGTYGSSHRNTLTFNGKPMLVYIGYDDSGPYMVTPFINPSGIGIAASGSQTGSLNATWGENSVSWYGTRDSSYQFNYTQTYNYIALTISGGDT